MGSLIKVLFKNARLLDNGNYSKEEFTAFKNKQAKK
jgi:hypothetical protein